MKQHNNKQIVYYQPMTSLKILNQHKEKLMIEVYRSDLRMKWKSAIFPYLDTQSIDERSSIKTTMSTSLSADEISADNYYKNAFYVFRALCKLSDRDIKDKGNADSKYVQQSIIS